MSATAREIALLVLRAWLDAPAKRGQLLRLARGERVYDDGWLTPEGLADLCEAAGVRVSWIAEEAQRRVGKTERAA